MSNYDELNYQGFMATQFGSNVSFIPGIENFKLPIADNNEAASNLELNLMLGKRAEKYFSNWIKASDKYEMLHENIQVFNDKITLGEFDFILKCLTDDRIIHVELVYKFYLLDPTIEDPQLKWIGPNRNDSLSFKLNKLRDKQFPLLYSLKGESTLSLLSIDTKNIEQQLAFFCNLFVPVSAGNIQHNMNPKSIEGYWYTLDEFKFAHCLGDQYLMPRKQDWFTRELPSVDWGSQKEVLEELKFNLNNQKSPLIWKLNEKGFFERLFVVWW